MSAESNRVDMRQYPITPMQAAFVREYLEDPNATQAAMKAGYSEKSAGNQAYRLLTQPKIKAFMEKVAGERLERQEEADKARRTERDVLDDIRLVTRSLLENQDFKSALKALELEGKLLGMFKEKNEPAARPGLAEVIEAARKRTFSA